MEKQTVYSMAWFDESLPDAVVEVAEYWGRVAERGMSAGQMYAHDSHATRVLERFAKGEFRNTPNRRFDP